MRDDFTSKIKDKLAKRVGYHCSNCWKPTSGPGESTDGVSLIGVAAHICAAAPGGPRYDEAMSSSERSSIKNGIWLCQNCAHLIDTNTERYTVEVLHNMKDKAESRAQMEISANGTNNNRLNTVNIHVTVRNKIIAYAKTMKQGAEYLREIGSTYKPATIKDDDIDVYNVCVCIYNTCGDLVYIEGQNHIQLKTLGLDKLIFNLRGMIPDFYDATNDYTGAQMIATNSDYMNYYASDAGVKFIKKCKKLIKKVEELES